MIKMLAAKLPRLALVLAILLPVWLLAVMFAAKFDLVDKLTAFGTLTIQTGLYASGVIAVMAVIGIVLSLLVKPRKGWAACLIALLVPAAFLFGLAQLRATAEAQPFIHDVATDTKDPPQFSAAMIKAREADGAKNKLYPFDVPLGTLEEWKGNASVEGKTLAQLIETGYPGLDLSTLTVAEPVAEVVGVIEDAMEMRGYDGITADPKTGIVEGTAEVFWYGFRDDVVARVRPAAGGKGSMVDFRSTSRVGLSDLGVNAKRVADLRQATLDRLTAQTPIGEGPAIMIEEAEDEPDAQSEDAGSTAPGE